MSKKANLKAKVSEKAPLRVSKSDVKGMQALPLIEAPAEEVQPQIDFKGFDAAQIAKALKFLEGKQKAPKPEKVVKMPPVLKGPDPESLKNQDIMVIAKALRDYEALAGSDPESGSAYASRAGQVRFLIWKRLYSI